MSNPLERVRGMLVPLPNAQGIYVRNDDLAKLIALADGVRNVWHDMPKPVWLALDALTADDVKGGDDGSS